MHEQDQFSDEELIADILAGHRQRANQLVKKWHLVFCKRAHFVLNDAELAKDVVQKCWMLIFDGLSDLKQPKYFKSWAFRIVYTKSIDAVRYRQLDLKRRGQLQVEGNSEADFESLVDRSQDVREQLFTAINNLSIAQQQVVRLFYLEAYNIREISKTLSISEGTVKSRLFHAREHLKNELKQFKNNY